MRTLERTYARDQYGTADVRTLTYDTRKNQFPLNIIHQIKLNKKTNKQNKKTKRSRQKWKIMICISEYAVSTDIWLEDKITRLVIIICFVVFVAYKEYVTCETVIKCDRVVGNLRDVERRHECSVLCGVYQLKAAGTWERSVVVDQKQSEEVGWH